MDNDIEVSEESDDKVDDGIRDDNNEDEVPWIKMFCKIHGNELFCEISEKFVQEPFNLLRIEEKLKPNMFNMALDIILDVSNKNYDQLPEKGKAEVDSSAETLYGILHRRYILSPEGLEKMKDKYEKGEFGRCPRVRCSKVKLLPVGVEDVLGSSPVHLYCGACGIVYYPPKKEHRGIDGYYWGASFPHHFFLVYPELKPKRVGVKKIQPVIHGFLVRNGWKRLYEMQEELKGRKETVQENGQRKKEIIKN